MKMITSVHSVGQTVIIKCLLEEISFRLTKLHDIAKKYDFLVPSNLLNEEYNCEVDAFDEEIKKEEFLVERTRLQHFVTAAGTEDMKEPLQLLQFIKKYNLGKSLLNIVIVISVPLVLRAANRHSEKLKLIKNHLRSTT